MICWLFVDNCVSSACSSSRTRSQSARTSDRPDHKFGFVTLHAILTLLSHDLLAVCRQLREFSLQFESDAFPVGTHLRSPRPQVRVRHTARNSDFAQP